jgi:16S rRNA (adenine1518-N6/adenine1519-N6)-dimethyltransferase
MLTSAELKSVLEIHRLRLTKRLGQHHLIDARAADRIVGSCALSPSDTVVEIGAGLGALTERLAQRAGRVIAVEVDRGISILLAERMRPWRNVEVVCQDILTFSWKRVTGATVVGAIPYHITSPILVSLCEARRFIRQAVLVIQAEVAQRLSASPGTKAYGRLSVLGQFCWQVASLFSISPNAFFPAPAVGSRCIRLLPLAHPPVAVERETLFFDVVKAAFSQRRKTLTNCLLTLEAYRMTRNEAESLLRRSELPASVRGEALSLSQFANLANALAQTER